MSYNIGNRIKMDKKTFIKILESNPNSFIEAEITDIDYDEDDGYFDESAIKCRVPIIWAKLCQTDKYTVKLLR